MRPLSGVSLSTFFALTVRTGTLQQVRPTGRREQTRGGDVAEQAQMYNGYCVKCKEKRDFEGSVAISKTGMRMAKGPCPVCGTTVNRILGRAS
jgi:hypothetical protein